jgi:hypothetical protein
LVELLLFMVGVPIASNHEVTFTEIHKANETHARAFRLTSPKYSMTRGPVAFALRWLPDIRWRGRMTPAMRGRRAAARVVNGTQPQLIAF